MSDFTKNCIGATVVLAFVIGAPVGCTVHQNMVMAEAIKSGADPIKVACAFRSDGKEPLCMEAVKAGS